MNNLKVGDIIGTKMRSNIPYPIQHNRVQISIEAIHQEQRHIIGRCLGGKRVQVRISMDSYLDKLWEKL